MNHLSTVWAEQCQNVRLAEAVRRERDRSIGVKIGSAYVPPPPPIMGCWEGPYNAEPSYGRQIMWGVGIVLTFMLAGWAL